MPTLVSHVREKVCVAVHSATAPRTAEWSELMTLVRGMGRENLAARELGKRLEGGAPKALRDAM